MEPLEIVAATLGSIGVVCTPIIGWVRSRFAVKDRKIELLEAKNEVLEKANNKLELQNLEQRIIGRTVNEFFSKLPAVEEPNKESPG